jgi:photosystem II stability/assembly factor-like uncharacterized protein
MSVIAPPEPPRPDELEALIREARARQRRRRLIFAAAVVVVSGASLSVWAAIPGLGSARSAQGGNAGAATSRGIDKSGRVPIVEVGTSGGVTWAINGLGMWLTTNGGRTWRASAPQHVREMGDVIARVEQVDFLDRRHAWLLAVDVSGGLHPAYARHAELDWTSDGGRTWHWTMPRGCCGAVSFLDPSRGWFLGPHRVMETTDAGAKWTPVSREPFAYGVPTFADAEHGVAVVGKGELYRTSDGGRRWSRVRLPGHAGALPNVAVFGRRLVIPAEVIGPPRSRLVVYVSDDAGESWHSRPAAGWVPLIGSDDPQLFSAASPTVWYATRWHELAVTRNAGRTWTPVKVAGLPRHWTIGPISFTSAKVGWAVFQRGYVPTRSVLMRTTDGGVHWMPAGPRKPKQHRR